MSYQIASSIKKPEWIVLICTSLALLLLPSKIRTEAVRHFSQPMTIQTSKTSPARVAFHETIDRGTASEVWTEDTQGSVTRVDLNQSMTQASATTGIKAFRYKKMILSPMRVPREQAMQILDQQNWLETLPGDLQGRLQEANMRSRVLEQNWDLPTTRDLLEEKLNEIQNQTSNEKASSIYVAGQAQDGTWMTSKDLHNQSGVRAIGAGANDIDGQSTSSNFATANVPGKFLVQGNLDINADTAWGPDRHVEVRWFDDGVAKETGVIDIKQGNYSIWLPQRSGTVVAQMVDSNGIEIGRGQYRISQTDTLEKLRAAAISIRPRAQVASNFYNFSKPDSQPSNNRKLASVKSPTPRVLMSAIGEEMMADADGQVMAQGIAQGSWTMMRTELKGYYPSIHLATAGEESAMPMFGEKMMQALLDIARENYEPGLAGQTGSVIWGRVTQNGKGFMGAHVEIEGMPEAKPIYFFSGLLLPDQKAKTTSADGYFAFVDVPRGFHSLRIKRGEQQIGFGNVEVDDGSVSPISISADPLVEKIPVKVFDAFTGSPERVDVEFQQLPIGIEIAGYAEIAVPHQQSLALAQVRPRNQMYVPSVHIFSGMDDYVHFPLIRLDWIQGLKAEKRINESTETGIIVGFVPGDDYEIDLPHAPDFDRAQIVYFDAQGMPTESGKAGGGFIVFNAPAGSHAIALLPKTTNVLHTRIAPVDPGTVSVLKFDF